jgi:replication factor A2
VGKILNVKEDNVTFNMLLDDGTGRITVKIFISNDDTDDFEKQKRAELREGIYVRVFGHVSHYNNERQINCFSARPLTDHNEVTYHLSQVIFQHLHLLKEEKDNGAPGGALKFDGSGAGGGQVGAGPIPSAVPGGYGFKDGLNPIQNEVLTIFNAPDALGIDVGLTIADVISRSGNRFNQQQVLSAVNYLVEEGHLYSTIDDAHWKSCSS